MIVTRSLGLLALALTCLAHDINLVPSNEYCELPQATDGRIYAVSKTDRPGHVPSGSYATVVCGEGSSVENGAVTAYCIDRRWQAPLGECRPSKSSLEECRKAVRIDNGQLVESGTHGQYQVECNPGFDRVGPTFVYCSDDGATTEPAKCQMKTTTPPPTTQSIAARGAAVPHSFNCYSSPVQNGNLAASSVIRIENGRFVHAPGTRITLSCNTGFGAVGGINAVCRLDGYWSQPVGFCYGLATTTTTTPPPPQPPPDYSFISDPLLPQMAATPTQYCYIPQLDHGTFSVSNPQQTSGRRTKHFHRISPTSVVTLTCEPGYSIAYGNGQSICQENGMFSTPLGDCIPMTTSPRTPLIQTAGTIVLLFDPNFLSSPSTPAPSPEEIKRRFIEAARLGNDADVLSMLQKGANPDSVDEAGNSALMLAARNGHIAVMKHILSRNANVNMKTPNGDTALTQAVEAGQQEAVRVLLEKGADARVNVGGLTPLLVAASKGYSGITALLLNFGADVTARDSFSSTALSLAARNGFLDTVIILLQANADINVVDYDGQSPLMWAAKNGQGEIVNFLLSNGADKSLIDANGYNAEDLARSNNFNTILETLRSAK